MNNEKIGFYSVDITIDEEDKPYLIEINGSNSGFDGFLIAYGDKRIQDAINSAFQDFIGNRRIFVVTRLVNFGELSNGYLDKLVQDLLYFRSIENVHSMFSKGTGGVAWARMRIDRPPSILGAGTSLDTLCELYPRFNKVMLNVTDPDYVLPAEYFEQEGEQGVISFKKKVNGTVQAIALEDNDVIWLRCPTLAFSNPIVKGIQINPEFPYNAIAHNKLFTYELLYPEFSQYLPISIPVGHRCSGYQTINHILSCSNHNLFIKKPLLGSQATGIEIIGRSDLEDYAKRIRQLEDRDDPSAEELPLELESVPELEAAWALSFDISLLSELTPSKLLYCTKTKRYHFGCMRTLALLKEDTSGAVNINFLGAYWRLARIPADGDGLSWERYVGSQSQGAFCEEVSSKDMAIAERFAKNILTAYYHRLSTMANTRQGYEEWENEYWISRYREQVSVLKYEKPWRIFLEKVQKAEDNIVRSKQQAESVGFRRSPSAILNKGQIVMTRLPYLIKEPDRIILP